MYRYTECLVKLTTIFMFLYCDGSIKRTRLVWTYPNQVVACYTTNVLYPDERGGAGGGGEGGWGAN